MTVRKLVPRDPTPKMVEEAGGYWHAATWRVMWDFAPADETYAALVEALEEACEFENDDAECLVADDIEALHGDCPDKRCKFHGCMVARVNRWRAALEAARKP